ncbi:MAG: hypothetical protein ACRENP_01710 [Longimicrobiales bacterium]
MTALDSAALPAHVVTCAEDARILELVAAFEACAVARQAWDHRAHLVYALVMLLRHGQQEGARRIREGILRYNAAQRIEQTLSGGYHESITRFYIWVVQRFVIGADLTEPMHVLARELYARCGDRDLPFQYYSRERLMSWQARTEWVEPDLQVLS